MPAADCPESAHLLRKLYALFRYVTHAMRAPLNTLRQALCEFDMKPSRIQIFNKWLICICIAVTIVTVMALWLFNRDKFQIYRTLPSIFIYFAVTLLAIYFFMKNLLTKFENIGDKKLEIIGSVLFVVSGYIGGLCGGYIWWLLGAHSKSVFEVVNASGVLGAIIIGFLLFGP